MSSKDKQKVIGEELDESKIARFLDMLPDGDENTDFHALIKAYRGLPATAFEQFLTLFITQGRNVNAAGSDGRTILQVVQQHSSQPGYVEALQKHGAQ